MTTDTTGTQWVRGLVKAIFVLCYIAFMWASIHHVATYFNDFEANGDTIGSYALAGAFDITALVTTIGVMFFRKSMPVWVLVIVWGFILAIAGYSFFVNWEYASHYQNMSLIMQPTGGTVPVFDTHGVLHYVLEMRANTALIWINPILASGFTIFSLIYSVIAEFFGTKLPTASELVQRKQYLEETSELLEEIKQLEQKGKKPSLIQRAKETAKELKSAANEIMKEEIAPTVSDNPGSEYADDIPAEMEEEEQENQAEYEEEEEQTVAQKRASLGMIEGMMYDKVMEDKTILFELLHEATMTSISDLTLSLQRRFSSYANFINEARVRTVFEAIKADSPELVIASNVPDTDPEMETVVSSNGEQAEGSNSSEATPFPGDDLPANVTDIAHAKKPYVGQNEQSNQLANGTDMNARRGAYAITKEAAAELLRCPISEIERGISSGILKPFAKDHGKILRSSLDGFVPQKRSRRTAKVATK